MTAEEEGILRDGSRVNFIVSCSPVRNANGEVISVVRVFHDVTNRNKAEEQVKASLKEKEVLLMEIHHRVENNLKILSSLLDLNSMQTDDPKAMDLFTDARATIHTMALIHSQLYQSDRFDQIDMEYHIRELIGFLSQIYASDLITPVIDCSDVYLPLTQAIPCALVTNERVSNAYKHAFAKGQKGTIDISLRLSAGGAILLSVKEEGIGIPDEVDIYKTDSMGLNLVTNLVQQQLKGEIHVIRDKGTEFIVEFKIVKEEDEIKYA
jgi:two-component sensor histidine kinase